MINYNCCNRLTTISAMNSSYPERNHHTRNRIYHHPSRRRQHRVQRFQRETSGTIFMTSSSSRPNNYAHIPSRLSSQIYPITEQSTDDDNDNIDHGSDDDDGNLSNQQWFVCKFFFHFAFWTFFFFILTHDLTIKWSIALFSFFFHYIDLNKSIVISYVQFFISIS